MALLSMNTVRTVDARVTDMSLHSNLWSGFIIYGDVIRALWQEIHV